MKKSKFIAITVLIIAMVTCLALGTLAFAEETDAGGSATPAEPNNKIPTSTIEAWKFGGGGDITSSYTDNGVSFAVPGADTCGSSEAWKQQLDIGKNAPISDAFSLKNNDKITLEFSAELFGDDGTVISKSQNSNALDIYILDASTNNQLGMLRIWTDAWGANNGNHSYDLYSTGWTNQGAGLAIMGDATANSKFFIQLDKQNFVSSYVGGADAVTPLGSSDLIADRQTALANVDKVYFSIRGENGFTNTTNITLRSINGQSLASTDGYFTDTVAPVFKPANVTTTIGLDEEFTIPAEAYDLLSGVTYSVKVGDGEFVAGKTFTPATEGELAVTLKATDGAGNSSTKDYTFQVTNNIAPPEITSVPAIEDTTVSFGKALTFDAPVYTDTTNAATVKLDIFKGENADLSADEPFAALTPNNDGKFVYYPAKNFETDTYKFVYTVTNKGGSVSNEIPVSAVISAETVNEASFVTYGADNMIADYVESGIRLRTTETWKNFYFGEFDLAEGVDTIDVKFIADMGLAGGNDVTYVTLKLENAVNAEYSIWYRVWLKDSGADAPCNVYVFGLGGNTDFGEMGWISRSVDGVANHYHMLFDMENTFQGERISGIAPINDSNGVKQKLADFFAAAPSAKYNLALEIASANEAANYREAVVTEINGQSFADPVTWNDAKLVVKSVVPEIAEKDVPLTIEAYAKDLRQSAPLKLSVTSPDGQSQILDFDGRTIEYTFTQLGNYKLTVSTVGSNGKEVKEDFNVLCKSAIQEITITLDGSYDEAYAVGSSVDIIGAAYSDNVVTSKIVIKTPSGAESEVQAGSAYNFAKPGIYTITYYAYDASEPTPNEKKVSFTVNVPDTSKPVVEVTIGTNYKTGEKAIPEIKITDDSEYDVTVTLEKPDKTTQKITGNYEITFETAGTYTLKVTVEDIYGNKETVPKTITVTDGAGTDPENKVGLIVGLCIGGVAVLGGGAAVAIILVKKKKVK